MTSDLQFVRTPNRTNSEIIDSFCIFCQTFVGASPRKAILQLMENTHSCQEFSQPDRPKPVDKKLADKTNIARRSKKRV